MDPVGRAFKMIIVYARSILQAPTLPTSCEIPPFLDSCKRYREEAPGRPL